MDQVINLKIRELQLQLQYKNDKYDWNNLNIFYLYYQILTNKAN